MVLKEWKLLRNTFRFVNRGRGTQLSRTTSLGFNTTWQNVVFHRRLKRMLLKLVIEVEVHRLRTWRRKLEAQFLVKYNLVLFRALHGALTLCIWQHFFLLKFRKQEASVPDGAPNYWLKRLVPPIEFGAMHAILFQLGLMPVTVSRNFLASMAGGWVARVFPFEHVMEFHIHIGYTFCAIMVASVALFFAFFGKVCSDHLAGKDPLDACSKFTSEIMLTGYGIFAATLIVLVSAYRRHKMAYEVFYLLHFFVFAMYILALLHTLDVQFRRGTAVGLARSQTWRWISASLLLYVSDRAFGLMNTATVPIVQASVAADSSTIVMHVRKPLAFQFHAGHYAVLQVPALGRMWHPFSIGSHPGSDTLVFLVEVKGPGSWTNRLQELIAQAGPANLSSILVRVQGPFGSPVSGNHEEYDSLIAIGTGTGIVPMLSLMEKRAERLKLLGKAALGEGAASTSSYLLANYQRASTGPRRGRKSTITVRGPSLDGDRFARTSKVVYNVHRSFNLRSLRSSQVVPEGQADEEGGRGPDEGPEESDDISDLEAQRLTQAGNNSAKVIGAIINIQMRWRLWHLTQHGAQSCVLRAKQWAGALGRVHTAADMATAAAILSDACLLALSLSWTNMPQAYVTRDMSDGLQVLNGALVAYFLAHCCYRWSNPGVFHRTFWTAVDLTAAAAMLGSYALWWLRSDFHPPTVLVINARTFLSLWRIGRLWQTNPVARVAGHWGFRQNQDLLGSDNFQLVWICRSGDLLAGYIPHLLGIVSTLAVQLYGSEFDAKQHRLGLGRFFNLQIYLTDRDPAKVEHVRALLRGTALEPALHYGRPNLVSVVMDNVRQQIMDDLGSAAEGAVQLPRHTFVTYCGSPNVASVCSEAVVQANVMATCVGHSNFRCTFREEFYGVGGNA